MTRKFLVPVVILVTFIFPAWALAQNPDDIGRLAEAAFSAFQGGQRSVALGFVLMLCVTLIRRFNLIPHLDPKWIPLATTLTGSVAGLGLGLSEGMEAWTAVTLGAMGGITAPGLWELIKPFVKK